MGVVDTIVSIIEIPFKIIGWVIGSVFRWKAIREYISDNQEYIDQVQEMDSHYRPEPVDVELGHRCKEYINQTFPNGIKEKTANMSQEELLSLFQQIESDAENLLGVHVDEVDFYTEAEPPQDRYFGYYSHDDNSFHINAMYILSGDQDLIQEQIYTIFHELKHARQWAAVLGEQDYGYSREQLLAWGENLQHYIPPCVSDELYRKQPVELDTYGFESILKGEKQFETI